MEIHLNRTAVVSSLSSGYLGARQEAKKKPSRETYAHTERRVCTRNSRWWTRARAARTRSSLASIPSTSTSVCIAGIILWAFLLLVSFLFPSSHLCSSFAASFPNPNLLTLRALDCLDCSWACFPSFFDVLEFVFSAFLLMLLPSQPYH